MIPEGVKVVVRDDFAILDNVPGQHSTINFAQGLTGITTGKEGSCIIPGGHVTPGIEISFSGQIAGGSTFTVPLNVLRVKR